MSELGQVPSDPCVGPAATPGPNSYRSTWSCVIYSSNEPANPHTRGLVHSLKRDESTATGTTSRGSHRCSCREGRELVRTTPIAWCLESRAAAARLPRPSPVPAPPRRARGTPNAIFSLTRGSSRPRSYPTTRTPLPPRLRWRPLACCCVPRAMPTGARSRRASTFMDTDPPTDPQSIGRTVIVPTFGLEQCTTVMGALQSTTHTT
jgi:hypothetical protein